MRTLIIAEAGVNHNGDISIAKKMIYAAKEAKADFIKFQTFKSENLVLKNAQKAEYQKASTGKDETQISMLKKLELTYDEFTELKKECENVGIGFLSTPFDFESIDFLHSIGMKIWKIPSGEVTNLPYLIKIAKYGQPVIISTGITDMPEVKYAVGILKNYGSDKITVMHCTTQYPAPIEEANLSAIPNMKKELSLDIGYSDHTEGILTPIIAVAMGASVIEKHFTLDRNMSGPDHKASIEPDDFKLMVENIRKVEQAIGDGVKKPCKSEICNKDIIRKSIIAKCKIKKGEIFTEDNLTTKRPGTGLSPTKWLEIIGLTSNKDYDEDEFISLDEK